MAIHDTIGDYLTIIRNAYRAGKERTSARYSKLREGIANILLEEGYIEGINVHSESPSQKFIDLTLKYVDGKPAMVDIQRWSKPGCRYYAKYDDIPRVLGGLGISILTTSRGVLRDRDARRLKVGGELLCKVW